MYLKKKELKYNSYMMDETTIQKIKSFVKKNPYPSYKFVEDMILSKARKWKAENEVELSIHYIMIITKYRQNNHNLMKEIYENIDNVELIKNNGCKIFKLDDDDVEAMEYNSYAFVEVLKYLIGEKAKTKFEQTEMYHIMKLQLQKNWNGVGEWEFMP